MRIHLIGLLLTLAAPLAAQERAPDPAAAADADSPIVVQGAREQVRNELWRILDTTEDHYARFDEAFCPRVIGFDAEWTPVLENLIRENAVRAGLTPRAAPCAPTAVVIFIDRPQELMQGLHRKMHGLFEGQYAAENRRLIDRYRPAYSWKAIELRSIDGVTVRDGSVRAIATRLSSNVRYDILNSYLVLDITKTPGMTLGQIADFASLHLLAEVAPESTASARSDSMLRLFEVADPTTLPARMNAFDRGMIAGLYDPDLDDAPAGNQRGRLAQTILREMREEGERAGEK